MHKILLDVPDKNRIFSDAEKEVIECAYLMNDMKMLLGDDWIIDYPTFTPSMAFFQFN